MEISFKTADGSLRVRSPYNELFAKAAHKLTGKWSGGAWVFEPFCEPEVRKMLKKYYAWDGEKCDTVIANVKALTDRRARGTIAVGGFGLCRAFDRDSGAKLCEGVALVRGEISSGGSRANWVTIIDQGSVFRIELPRHYLKTSENWEITEYVADDAATDDVDMDIDLD